MSKLKIVLSGLILTVGFAACNSASESAGENKDSTVAVASTPAVLQDSDTEQVYKHYLHLKDELVASNAAEAQKAGKELAAALAKIKGCENTSLLADKIASSNNIVDQRIQFTALSSDIIAMMKHTDISSGSLYIQHCPMANDGEGGYWLSSEKEIRNPYYGDEMLECGSVKEVISAK